MPPKKQCHETGLNALLSSDSAARDYFMSLPDYVQGMIQQRSDSVHTSGQLHSYGEKLLAGDI